MILCEWRGKVETAFAEAYPNHLKSTGLADYAETPGRFGTLVLPHDEEQLTEFALLSLWESEKAIMAFAGANVTAARFYPGCGDYSCERWSHVCHYQAVVADMRTPAKRNQLK